MDYTLALTAAAPLAVVALAAATNHLVSKYIVSDDDVDCVGQYTAADAKHYRRAVTGSKPRVSLPALTSPTGNKTMPFGRNPLR